MNKKILATTAILGTSLLSACAVAPIKTDDGQTRYIMTEGRTVIMHDTQSGLPEALIGNDVSMGEIRLAVAEVFARDGFRLRNDQDPWFMRFDKHPSRERTLAAEETLTPRDEYIEVNFSPLATGETRISAHQAYDYNVAYGEMRDASTSTDNGMESLNMQKLLTEIQVTLED